MAELKVLDVSQFNTVTSWAAVAGAVDAVIVRAGYRGYGKAGNLKKDSRFDVHMQGAVGAGILVGVYWCSQALSDAEALEEARYLRSLIEQYKITYPVYLDSEHMAPNANGRADQIEPARRTQYGLTFCRAMEDYGYKAGLYCSESWYTAQIDGAAFDRAGFSIWIAKYSNVKPRIPRYDIWQYTSSARVAGVKKSVDLSIGYVDFAAAVQPQLWEKAIDALVQLGRMDSPGVWRAVCRGEKDATPAQVRALLSKWADDVRKE